MGKKYIIELEDKPFHKEGGDFLYRVKGFNSLVFDMTGIGKLTPYTEPDLEQVRKEAYQKGYETGYEDGYNEPGKNQQEAYQRGLANAWDAARKISLAKIDGGFSWESMNNMFGTDSPSKIYKTFTASESIEKIRQYEQKKQEKDAEIKVGKEFQMGERKCVVTHIIDGTQCRVLWDNGVSGLVGNTDLFVNLTPTGRYFPEVAAVLEKM